MKIRQRWPWASALFGALLLCLMAVPLIARADPASSKIELKVLEQLARKDEATFWVVLGEEADLGTAPTIRDWNERGRFVVSRLQAVAGQSQAGARAYLDARGVPYRSFWILNALEVTANRATVDALAARPEVAQILAPRQYTVPQPKPSMNVPASLDALAVEWGIERVRAPETWATFGTRGEGIIVANVDTGVHFTHPAVAQQYRGNLGGGLFDHNYNWFDPSNVCAGDIPCDNNDHGTHTMGTMVGDDGDPGPHQIGMAPQARWIAAKGCESGSCSDSALLASGQWILAPTDLQGNNARPDLRPHVVNNSWGGGGGDPFYMATVQAWVASGIFPAFSNGNSGPGCSSSGSPGDFPITYSAGAFDVNNNIASFSSRGPAIGGGIKPNIAAPGVAVLSSVPPNGYARFDGTSMASPHVAGAVALMWAAAPSLIGDIEQTRELLDLTAVDTSDLSCGGTAQNNNVWGEGKLDVYAAVDASPRGPTGTLQGTVTGAAERAPIAGARVHITGPSTRTLLTDNEGEYSTRLPVGSYDMTISAFGRLTETLTGVAIAEDAIVTRNVILESAPTYTVSGMVRDDTGNPVPNATVSILGTPLAPVVTGANGAFTFSNVPQGSYEMSAEAGRCAAPAMQTVMVTGNQTVLFELVQRVDAFGYRCRVNSNPAFVSGLRRLQLAGDDSSVGITLPFAFPFYGASYTQAAISTNGFLNFLANNTTYSNTSIPAASAPNAAIYPFWDDLVVDANASVWVRPMGQAPNRRYVIEWRNLSFFGNAANRVDVEVILFESGHIAMLYRNLADDGQEQGNSATIGIENANGTVAFQYSFQEAVLGTAGGGVIFLPPAVSDEVTIGGAR